MGFYREDRALARARLSAAVARVVPEGSDDRVQKLVAACNRIGGLLETFAARTGVPVRTSLAVWFVESGGREFTRGRPVLRFEAHKFWQNWGAAHAEGFDRHFQFGGRGGVEGRPWQAQKFRRTAADDWATFHGDQAKEYAVFEFAAGLGGREAACLSSSFGGPQILGSNHAIIGYDSAAALFKAFARSERWHVCGFFDYCRSHRLMDAIQAGDWLTFARAYNGEGQAADYARLIGEAHGLAGEIHD